MLPNTKNCYTANTLKSKCKLNLNKRILERLYLKQPEYFPAVYSPTFDDPP